MPDVVNKEKQDEDVVLGSFYEVASDEDEYSSSFESYVTTESGSSSSGDETCEQEEDKGHGEGAQSRVRCSLQ